MSLSDLRIELRKRADMEAARLDYETAIAYTCESNLTDEDQERVLDELEQFLVDMMDYCEQTLVAEPAIVAAHQALVAARAAGRPPR